MDKKITFYTIGCPKCKVLKIKLDKAEIPYDLVDNLDEMTKLGITTAPMLKVGDKLMDFSTAINWINMGANELC